MYRAVSRLGIVALVLVIAACGADSRTASNSVRRSATPKASGRAAAPFESPAASAPATGEPSRASASVGDTAPTIADRSPARPAGPARIHVDGNKLIDPSGREVRLLGVNRNSTEFVCFADGVGDGYIHGPRDAASVKAMAVWGINAVRVPLAEPCWFGASYLPAGRGGEPYRRATREWVDVLTSNGMYVVLDYHVVGTMPRQRRCPDSWDDYGCDASRFWREVASAFKDNGRVLFDIYNEVTTSPNPHQTGGDLDFDWECWRDGGADCRHEEIGIPDAVGMQDLVNVVRGTGAVNPILAGGPLYAGTTERWLEYRLHDPLNQLIASVHEYKYAEGPTHCTTIACYDAEIAPVAARVPVVVGEFGETTCESEWVEELMQWSDGAGVSYLAWGWRVYDPGDGATCAHLTLIEDYNGTPRNYGGAVRAHLQSLS